MTERVILVDEHDNEIGTEEKIAAHRKGLLHRAFSILVFDSRGRILLQQRAAMKYHWPLAWANTCCSHPRPGEDVLSAAHRRLQEEMGFDCPLEERFTFTYRAVHENGLIEHEFDHVFFGWFDGTPQPDNEEVAAYEWKSLKEIREDLGKYAPWFQTIVRQMPHMRTGVAEYAVIVENGKTLMLQWHDNRESAWHFPGGRLMEGEREGEGLLREVREEIGVDVEVVRPIYTKWFAPENAPRYAVFYLCRLVGKPRLLTSDHKAMRWIGKDEPVRLWQPFYKTILENAHTNT